MGNKLTNRFVGVFDKAILPGAVGVGESNEAVEFSCDEICEVLIVCIEPVFTCCLDGL